MKFEQPYLEGAFLKRVWTPIVNVVLRWSESIGIVDSALFQIAL